MQTCMEHSVLEEELELAQGREGDEHHQDTAEVEGEQDPAPRMDDHGISREIARVARMEGWMDGGWQQ